MGHLSENNIYRKLGERIDNLTLRTPWNDTLHALLRELCTAEEAEVVIKMPNVFSTFGRIQKITNYEGAKLRRILDRLCEKGFIMDLRIRDEYHYMPSPIAFGIYELAMMRTGNNLNTKEWARLFNDYFEGNSGSFFAANFKHNEKISILRTLPHEDAINLSEYTEVLDYEKASAIIENSIKFSIGICACRNVKLHIGKKTCDVPLETCSSFGFIADYLIRRNAAREVSKSEMLENLARSKEEGLVITADNVKRTISMMCHCCKCCCKLLLGIREFGYPNALVTSGFIIEKEGESCLGCGKCAQACPINAIEMRADENLKSKTKASPKINKSICLGCGVCALNCPSKSLMLIKRKQHVIHPETIFERIILQTLERGTLQHQLFDNPQSVSQKFMRGFIGAFLNLPPVKSALMSDMFRSRFLKTLKNAVRMQGKGWLTEL